MELNLGETKFLIKKENITKVIEAFRKKFEDYEDVRTEDVNTIEDVFWQFGYNIIKDDVGNITEIDNVSSDLPDGQNEFFEAIASAVEDGSFIHLKREDTHWKFVFEKGKVKRLDSEIVFYDRPMTYDRAMCLINEFIEHLCDVKRISEAIEELFRVGFTDDELVEVFNFDKTDVERVVSSIEEDT